MALQQTCPSVRVVSVIVAYLPLQYTFVQNSMGSQSHVPFHREVALKLFDGARATLPLPRCEALALVV